MIPTALCASFIARVIDESSLAGLAGLGYIAKSFLATGATCAIEGEMEPEIVRKVGRWKNSDVLFAHYVHFQTPQEYSGVV